MADYIFKHELKDQALTLYFKGEINFQTSQQVENEAMSILKQETFKEVILDFHDVTYVSSAGLRVILKIKQTFINVSIINASLNVYDVLQMTGFTNIMDIKKTLKEIDIEGSPIIGEGYFSIVYRIDKDTIVKVYKEDTDIKEVERELNMAKQAFILGIPTAISFDVVKVKDKLGVRFEMLNSSLLRDLYLNHPENFDEYNKKYAELLKKINTTETNDETLPHTLDLWLEKVRRLKDYLDDKDYQKIYKMVENIGDRSTFVHGDCHVKNIMVQDNELFLIDMDTLSKGHPIFELASIVAPYSLFEEDEKGNNQQFFKLDNKTCERIYNDTLNEYFQEDNLAYKEKIRLLGYLHMMWWTLSYQKENTLRFNNCKMRFLKLLEKYDDFNINL